MSLSIRCPGSLLFVSLLLFCQVAEAWQHPLYLSGGGFWRQRVKVKVSNDRETTLEGHPVALSIGDAPGQLPLVGQNAAAVRVCNAQGSELLFALQDSDGAVLREGPIPMGSTLVLPVDCEARSKAMYFVYFDNPHAGAPPDVFTARAGVINGDVEFGEGPVPLGWRHERGDEHHQVFWSSEQPQSGVRCLKTVVAADTEPTWISTRQHGIAMEGGAKYRMQAWVRAQNVRGFAGWYLQVGNRQQPRMTAHRLDAGGGTFAWKQVTAEFTAPADADRVSLGTALRGTGTAWFDNVTFERLSPLTIRAKVSPVESMALREVGAEASWYRDQNAIAPGWSHRAVVKVWNFDDEPREPTFVSVRLSGSVARMRGWLNRDSVVVTLGGRPLRQFFWIGDLLLFEARLPPRSAHTYHVYFSGDLRFEPSGGTGLSRIVDLPANRVQNPSFEQGDRAADAWTHTRPQHGATYGFDDPRRAGRGRRCARITVPADAPVGWRGWHQTVPVRPSRTYLLAAWVKCEGVEKSDVRLHFHCHTANGALSQHSPFSSIGPSIRDTTDWSLMSGYVFVPADTTSLALRLTMQHTGVLWHDDVVVVEVVPGEIAGLEGKPNENDDELSIWQVPAVVKVFQDDPPPRKPTAAHISAARNDIEPLQLAVRSGRAMTDLGVVVDPITGPDNFRLQEVRAEVVGYVPIDHPSSYYRSEAPAWHRKIPSKPGRGDGWSGLWPDPLLPQATFALRPRRTQPLWITVTVPKEAPAGDYAGRVRLLAGESTVATVPFQLHVWDFTLPDENHVAAIYDVRLGRAAQLWGKPLSEMYPQIIRFMASRRLCPDTILPAPKFAYEGGVVTADFTEFDKAATVYFDELKFPFAYAPRPFYVFGWGHPPQTVFGQQAYAGDPPYEAADRSRLNPQYRRVYQQMLRVFWEHVKEKGWSKRIVLYISDEPFYRHEHILQQMKALCAMIHEVDPEIPVYSSTWKHIPDWDDYLDIWGIGHDGRVPTDKMAELRAAGKRIWFTTDGQMCTDTPYCAVERLLPHYCFKYGAEAYEFWGIAWLTRDPFRYGWHSYIHQTSEPGKSFWVRYPNGDGFLLYPGNLVYRGNLAGGKEVVSSIRLEQAREGVEDYEYLYLLQQLIERAKTAGIDTHDAQKALESAQRLVQIPNAGGYFSTKILPAPEKLYEMRAGVAAAIESMQAATRRAR